MHDLLDEEVAERDSDEAALAVADGVEHRGIGHRLDVRFHLSEDELLHGAREPPAERHLHEDEGLVGKGGMKEPEAAPVRRQAALQVLPVEDLVYRLVLDDLLEHESGGVPVDAPDLEEPTVEPGAEQVEEVRVERLELRQIRQSLQQRLAHCEEIGHAVRRGVEKAEQVAARRLGGPREGGRSPRTGRLPIRFDGAGEGGGFGDELIAEEPEELAPAGLVKPSEGVEGGAGESHHRRLATGAQEGPADLPDIVALGRCGRPRAPTHEPAARPREACRHLLPERAREPHDGAPPSGRSGMRRGA